MFCFHRRRECKLGGLWFMLEQTIIDHVWLIGTHKKWKFIYQRWPEGRRWLKTLSRTSSEPCCESYLVQQTPGLNIQWHAHNYPMRNKRSSPSLVEMLVNQPPIPSVECQWRLKWLLKNFVRMLTHIHTHLVAFKRDYSPWRFKHKQLIINKRNNLSFSVKKSLSNAIFPIWGRK